MSKSPLSGLTLGIFGCGRMGSAIARALVDQNTLQSDRIYLHDRDPQRAQTLSNALGEHAQQCVGSDTLLQKSDVVLLAIKPQDAPKALRTLSWINSKTHTVVSVLAGTRIETLRGFIPNPVHIARAMPNTPALIGAGVTGILRTQNDTHDALTEALFASCGHTVFLDKESLFDAVTGLSGSGPAYVFVALEALADGGVKMGLPRAVAQELAAHTLYGASRLALESNEHTATLKDQVSSPAGTTIHGLSALEDRGFRSSLIAAVEARNQTQ